MHLDDFHVADNEFKPYIFQDFHCFWTQFIRGQSIKQRSMGCEAPRYPPQYPGP